MKLASLISWIDREWDQSPKAACSLGLILAAAWLPLMLIGWNAGTITVAAVWGVVWIALYAWRWLALIKRLDARWSRKRPRR